MGETSLDKIAAWISRNLDSLFDLIYPRRCAGCGQPGEVWCLRCDRRMERLPTGFCQNCRHPLAGPGVFCKACQRELPEPLIASFAHYRQPLRRALVSLKYRPDTSLAGRMAGWLANLYQATDWKVSIVVPVPLGRLRRRQRGFNQAELLARPLAAELGLVYRPQALYRHRETPSQVGLDHNQRGANVADAFAAVQPLIAGKRVLLVDDLVTTGSTLQACAAAMEDAEEIFGLTVARA